MARPPIHLFDCISPESIAREVECWNCEATRGERGLAIVVVVVAARMMVQIVIFVVAFAGGLDRRHRYLMEFDDPHRE